METTLEVQKYLRSGKTLADLKAQYAVEARPGKQHPNLVSLKYSMIDSPMGERIVQECRGIILDMDDNWRVVARPFDKFFNYGEGHAAVLDWSKARVQEKLDGSLMILYHYKGEWRVASSGTPDGAGEVGDTGITFSGLFWKVWNELGYELPHESEQELTFLFELMTPYNRVVCRQPENRVVLIGVRDRINGIESAVREFYGHDWQIVKEFKLDTMDDIAKSFERMDPYLQEGYVVVDGNFNRVKVKHPGYVAIHHLKDSTVNSVKNLMTVVLKGESDEFATAFPEYAAAMVTIKETFNSKVVEIQDTYTRIKDIVVQKEFALEAIKTPYSGILFQHRKTGTPIRTLLLEMPVDKLQALLGLKELALLSE